MAPKKKEHSNDLRTLVIQHYHNGDSLSEITSLSRSTVQYIWSTSINQQNVLVAYLDVFSVKGKQKQQQINLFNVISSSIDENQLRR